MAITDTDPFSNSYFFITGFSDVFGAGKNSFTLNCTNKVIRNEDLQVSAYDINGNALSVSEIKVIGPYGVNSTSIEKMYVVNVPMDTPNGIGSIEIIGMGADVGQYTGSIAYFNDQIYPVSKNTRLPLIQAPNTSPFPITEVKWNRNILINTAHSTTSEVRFFDAPNINIIPELYYCTDYPNALYKMDSGSCSAISIKPKNNSSADIDYSKEKSIYQLYANGSYTFKSSMEGEKIRIKNPYVKNFTYTNQSNNQIEYEGTLNTDFIATIEKVLNATTLLIDIPFSTVGDLIGRINEDSFYTKNNLVNIFGYNVSNDPDRQTVYRKRNFSILSISSAEYEIFYKDFPDPLSLASSVSVKSLINVEFNNLRAYSGNISSYKIYGKSLNTPESKILLCESKVEPDELIKSTNFRSGIYNSPGRFYSQAFLNNFWLKTDSSVILTQTSSIYIDGAYIGHNSNSSETDYVLFKDDTTGGARTTAYTSFSFPDKSYWYATSEAFLNSGVYPVESYTEIVNIPILPTYSTSVENLLIGAVHDSNPIKLRATSLYEFTMKVRPDFSNNEVSQLKIYFTGSNGQNGNGGQRLIGTIDSNFKFGSIDTFSATFFMDVNAYGTIKIVPISGKWHIANLSLKPYTSVDYSIDSFSVKIPLKPLTKNALYDIEAELYDADGTLAYGAGSYSFESNKTFAPLKKRIFVNPSGIATV